MSRRTNPTQKQTSGKMPALRSQAEFFMTGVVPTGALPGEDCSICTEKLTEDVVKMVACQHSFHCVCVLPWLQGNKDRNRTCPNCRTQLYEASRCMCGRSFDAGPEPEVTGLTDSEEELDSDDELSDFEAPAPARLIIDVEAEEVPDSDLSSNGGEEDEDPEDDGLRWPAPNRRNRMLSPDPEVRAEDMEIDSDSDSELSLDDLRPTPRRRTRSPSLSSSSGEDLFTAPTQNIPSGAQRPARRAHLRGRSGAVSHELRSPSASRPHGHPVADFISNRRQRLDPMLNPTLDRVRGTESRITRPRPQQRQGRPPVDPSVWDD